MPVHAVLWLLLHLQEPADSVVEPRGGPGVIIGAAGAQRGEVSMASEVAVGLYSGRPNPRAALDIAQDAELTHRIAALKPLARELPPADGLGYRGLRIVGGRDASFLEIEVFAGAVQIVDRSKTRRVLADSGRALEKWLLRAVRAGVDREHAAALDHVLEQVEREAR
jgi:hypothetical protein